MRVAVGVGGSLVLGAGVFASVADVGGEDVASAGDGHAGSEHRIADLSRGDARGSLAPPTHTVEPQGTRTRTPTSRQEPTPRAGSTPRPSPSEPGTLDRVLRGASSLTSAPSRLASSVVPSPSDTTDGGQSPTPDGDRSGSGHERGSGSSDRRDTDPPQTEIHETDLPDGSVVFRFSSDEKATFTCSLDAGGWEPCAAGTSYTDPEPGWHTLDVRATDLAGNTDPTPAEATWKTTGMGGGVIP